MSKIFVDQVDPKTGTSLTLGTSGDTVNIPSGVTLANAGTVTGLPASAISSGTIATARLGSGTASSSTFLRGDQTYAAAGVAGTILFQATGTSSQTGNADNTSTKRNFVSEIFDTANAYDTSTSRFTVPSGQAGKYLITANINMEAASNGVAENAELQIRVNGASNSGRNTFLKSNNNEFDRFDMNQTTILNLSVGDYVEIYGNMNTNGGETWDMYAGAATNVFSGFRIA